MVTISRDIAHVTPSGKFHIFDDPDWEELMMMTDVNINKLSDMIMDPDNLVYRIVRSKLRRKYPDVNCMWVIIISDEMNKACTGQSKGPVIGNREDHLEYIKITDFNKCC